MRLYLHIYLNQYNFFIKAICVYNDSCKFICEKIKAMFLKRNSLFIHVIQLNKPSSCTINSVNLSEFQIIFRFEKFPRN